MNCLHRKFWQSLCGLGICLGAIVLLPASAAAQRHLLEDLSYKPDATTEYEKTRCRLDIYLPKPQTAEAQPETDFPTIIWFHGGGLTAGDKQRETVTEMANRFNAAGFAVVSVNYRLSPQVKYPAYIEDTAAALAFVKKMLPKYGGDSRRIFVAGHSAGGYLTAMVGLDPQWLKAHNLKPTDFAGYIPISGQMITHFTVREERGLSRSRPLVDEAAPLFHVTKQTAPFLCLAASEDLPTRAEENLYFVSAMKASGHLSVRYLEFAGRDHGSIAHRLGEENDPVGNHMIEFMSEP